jgi:hypothetical protein
MLTGLCILRRNRIFCNKLEEISLEVRALEEIRVGSAG